MIDEYLAVRVLQGRWPAGLPVDELALPTSRHWRLLQAVHNARGGQLSQLLSAVTPAGRDIIRYPHPEVVAILPLLDDAAAIAARVGTAGWLIAETFTAGLVHNSQLWFGTERNVGPLVDRAAPELGITVHVLTCAVPVGIATTPASRPTLTTRVRSFVARRPNPA